MSEAPLQVYFKMQCPVRHRFTGAERRKHDLVVGKMPVHVYRKVLEKLPTKCGCGQELEFEGTQRNGFL